MALTTERKGEIALAILKAKAKKERRLPDANELKRNIGNLAKELGFSKAELTEFVVVLLKEVTKEIVSEIEEIDKTGESK